MAPNRSEAQSIQSGRIIQRRNQYNANRSKLKFWRVLHLLDLRFTDPSIESKYHLYYAQVKRDLLPTAIQVVLLVNTLQFLLTLFNYYLISGQDFSSGSLVSYTTKTSQSSTLSSFKSYNDDDSDNSSSEKGSDSIQQQRPVILTSNYSSTLRLPIILQLMIFVLSLCLLKSIRKELSSHHRRQSASYGDVEGIMGKDLRTRKRIRKYEKEKLSDTKLDKPSRSVDTSLKIAEDDVKDVTSLSQCDSDSTFSQLSSNSASQASSQSEPDNEQFETINPHDHKSNKNKNALEPHAQEAIKLKRKKRKISGDTRDKKMGHMDEEDCDEDEERQEEKQLRRKRKIRRSSALANNYQKVSKFRLAMPYILWLLQFIQIASALWPQQSFIAYSSLLLYCYAIYVILPIRLLSCIILATSMCLLEPCVDWLLLFKLKNFFSFTNDNYQESPTLSNTFQAFNMTSSSDFNDALSFNLTQSQNLISPEAQRYLAKSHLEHATSDAIIVRNHLNVMQNSNAIIASVLTIPMTSQISKLWSFMLLALGINIIGIMSFFFYDRQQRSAFIETRQNFSTKLTLEQESREQERLLLSILPKHLASEIRQDLGAVLTGQFKKIYMRRHENVSILFADIVGFTAISSHCPAPELVKTLNELFARFDKLAEKYHQLRIKILGDCYYAISGAPKERSDHAVLCVHMGLSMVEAIKSVRERTKSTVDMRVGVHTGGVLAGVLGQRQWQFDVYSKDVELANKMESSGLPGRVHISNATLRFLNDEFEVCDGDGAKREEALRLANIKTYFIVRVKKPYPEGTLDAPLAGQEQIESAKRIATSTSGGGPRQTGGMSVVITINSQDKVAATNLMMGNKEIKGKKGQFSGDGQKSVVVRAGNGSEKTLQQQDSEGRPGGRQNESGNEVSEQKQRNDSFELDNEIKRVSLNFCNSQFEKQFRSTSDITSCVSLVGLPITLICAFSALVYLYKVSLDVALVYSANSIILMMAVAVCVLPYLWRQQKLQRNRVLHIQQQQLQQSSERGVSSSLASSGPLSEFSGVPRDGRGFLNCCLRTSHAVGQSAWMKLVLSALMTLLWLSAHLLACVELGERFANYLSIFPTKFSYISLGDFIKTQHSQGRAKSGNISSPVNTLSNSELQELLFGVDLVNYFSVICALAITAITRISFLVKTIMILVVIIQQVILNKTILANLLMLRSTFMLVLPQMILNITDGSEKSPNFKSNQSFRSSNLLPQDSNQIELGESIAEFDQYVFTVTLSTLFLALFSMNRHFELTNRRMFLYRKQAEERKEKVADMRRKNEMLVYNILPPNVAKIFLGKRQLNDEELYSKSYDAVGVLFAAMPNFSDFYSEESVNNQGLECLRFLNEVISDYDALLDQHRFKNIIKIKTMGSTYMAASGLYEGDALSASSDIKISEDQPSGDTGCSAESKGVQNQDDEIKAKWGHLVQLTEFALALKDTLNNINKESFNNFVLRIGINQGPITAGVIGVKKPHFDMWGNTVNVASRMESTGRAGSIQVVEETATILRHFGFEFDQRGLVSVKGKGKLMTFYLTGRNAAASAASNRISNSSTTAAKCIPNILAY